MVTPGISHAKVAGPLRQVSRLTHMHTCHMPGWEQPCCALTALELFPHNLDLPPVGNWGKSLCFLGPQLAHL